jgi:hypothetical protein
MEYLLRSSSIVRFDIVTEIGQIPLLGGDVIGGESD